MLYACSILYKSKLPFILAFNKVDVISHNFCIEWMTDYDALYDAISQDTSYMYGKVNLCMLTRGTDGMHHQCPLSRSHSTLYSMEFVLTTVRNSDDSQ